MMLQTTTGT